MFGAWLAASEAAHGDVPLAASEHNAIRWPGSPRLAEMRRALARVEACFAHGPAAAATVLDLGLPPARVHPACSAIEQTSPMALPRLPRPRLIFAGRLHPEKGPDLLVEAFARLREPVPAYMLGGGPLATAVDPAGSAGVRSVHGGSAVHVGALTGVPRREG
jgi:glycosyltransferase involved in cell wall biosynthesis